MSNPSGRLNFFTVFHLNLAYSAIEEERRREVLKNCYWPLLELVENHDAPLGIEASGYTLEEIHRLDPSWTEKFRSLVDDKSCEFVGSGYAQIIGPLVPAKINRKNLKFGLDIYDDILNVRPQIALINEQAYSGGLLELYDDAGYNAIFTEWDNPASRHGEWNETWQYYPQIARGPDSIGLPVLWNHSIAFQKFQRYAHGELSLRDYVEYLGSHVSDEPRLLCLYGNDVEVFDFRPGRYHTEADLKKLCEWNRINDLFEEIIEDKRFNIVSPSRALSLTRYPNGGHHVRLESSQDPVVVKKQRKYNITRWAVTGRNDLDVNTRCWRLYDRLVSQEQSSDSDWKELCYLWSSDFRTHITDDRWSEFLCRLERAEADFAGTKFYYRSQKPQTRRKMPKEVGREGDMLEVQTDQVRIRLNCRRGLAIEGVWFNNEIGPPRFGTLPFGYFGDIGFSADWYTGHTILEIPGEPKVTDLNPTEPAVWTHDCGDIIVRGKVQTRMGPIIKTIEIEKNSPGVRLTYQINWDYLPIGSLRLGHITLHPEAFEQSSLYYRTNNGGRVKEAFPLGNSYIGHGDPVSFMVSGRAGFGLTEGSILLGDATHAVRIEVYKHFSSLIGMVTFDLVNDSYFCRLALSALEMDETSRNNQRQNPEIVAQIRLSPEDPDS
jgi:hypothetical protein